MIIKVEVPEETSKIASNVSEEGKQATVEEEVEAAKAVAADGKQDVEVGKEGEEQGLNPKRSRKQKNPSSDSKSEHEESVSEPSVKKTRFTRSTAKGKGKAKDG
jgi:hypothetical protein